MEMVPVDDAQLDEVVVTTKAVGLLNTTTTEEVVVEHPSSVTVCETVCPPTPKVIPVGLATVEVGGDPPEKVHACVPVEPVFVKLNEFPVRHWFAEEVNVLAGFGNTLMNSTLISSSPSSPLLDFKCTVKTPGVLYVTVGFCTIDVTGLPPLKVQVQPVGFSVVKSVKFTDCPAQMTVMLAVKSATRPGAKFPGVLACRLKTLHTRMPKKSKRLFMVLVVSEVTSARNPHLPEPGKISLQ